tara:strand:+ start:198 stop:746 length:549 start_codon:yes stop_codon:yes gene_type:complete
MAKKTITLTNPDFSATNIPDEDPITITGAIRNDVKVYTEADSSIKQSGKDVAHAFDHVKDSGFYDNDWTRFLGNSSAASCGMDKDTFKAVKAARAEYKTAFLDAGHTPAQFDARWQYVKKCSMWYTAPVDSDEVVGKSTEAKLEEAIRSVHRHATTLEADEEISLALELMSLRGLEVNSKED